MLGGTVFPLPLSILNRFKDFKKIIFINAFEFGFIGYFIIEGKKPLSTGNTRFINTNPYF